MNNFLKPLKVLNILSRNIGNAKGRRVYKWEGEGIKYPGFTYYPRFADFKDPPCEPSKLFMVRRIKPVKGTPYWERKILKDLGLVGKSSELAIVKNIPENNSRLYKIKHLIEIKPITFPNGFPQDANGTYLKENGELVVAKIVGDQKRLRATEEFEKDPKRMDGDTLRRDSRLKWLSGW